MGRVYPLLILSIVRRPSGRPASCFSRLGCSKTSSKGYSLCSSRWYWASDWSVPLSTAPPCSAKTATALSFVVEFFSRGCGSFPYWRSLVGIGVVPLYRNVNVNQKFRNVWRLFVMCMMKYVRKIGKKNEKVRDQSWCHLFRQGQNYGKRNNAMRVDCTVNSSTNAIHQSWQGVNGVYAIDTEKRKCVSRAISIWRTWRTRRAAVMRVKTDHRRSIGRY